MKNHNQPRTHLRRLLHGSSSGGFTLTLAFALFLTATASLPAQSEKKTVFVTIPPLASVIEKLSPEPLDVQVLVKPSDDPHTFELTPRQAVSLGKTDVFFSVGLEFENNLVKRFQEMNPDARFIDLSQFVQKRKLTTQDAGEAAHHAEAKPKAEPAHEHHDHEHDHDHDHAKKPKHNHDHHDHAHHQGHDHAHHDHDHGAGAEDPHYWLDPVIMANLVPKIQEGLAPLVPDSQDRLAENAQALRDELKELNDAITKTLEPYRGEVLFVYHPAFGYFADRYGLVQESVEVGGKSPTARQVTQIVQRAKGAGVKVIFVQPQFDPKSAQLIAQQIDGRVEPLSPLAPDLLANLREMAETIARAYEHDHDHDHDH